ncbi:hypothetical protein [Legionella spiritensis]|uniref:Protein LphB n=1 Tax=Legionella spiritensis TaxID=452 RepID=A0A0W0YXS4_LEGSP|nr:hypothetical protein [Legionella spiritensis]KTD61395.1 protein LphB [Legionella spiritensis]SNV33560.1 protein LphB [Legionella spiritensis]
MTDPGKPVPACNRNEYLFVAVITVIIGVTLAAALSASWIFTTDDAFISWRYADQLIHGYGLRWNSSGEPVEGYSNFLWMLLTALVMKLDLPLLITMKWIAVSSLIVSLVVLYRLARTFLSPLLAVLPVYLLSRNQGVVWWTISGLETGFYMAFVLLSAWTTIYAFGYRNHEHARRAFSPKIWFLACALYFVTGLIRFDGAVWSGIFAVFIVCNLSREKNTVPVWPMVWIAVFAFVMPYMVYLGWRWFYFGALLPNSYACKASFGSSLSQVVVEYLPVLFPCIVLGLPCLLGNKDCRHILLWLPSLVYCLILARANPIITYYYRLFLPAFSLLTVLPVLGIQEFFSYFALRRKTIVLFTVISVFLVNETLLPTYQTRELKLASIAYQERFTMRLQVASYLNHHAGIHDRVLISDAGTIPFFARRDIQFIDDFCLNNKAMLRSDIHRSEALYAIEIEEHVKPHWVISTFYPLLNRWNEITNVLRKRHFFDHCERVAEFASRQYTYNRQGEPKPGPNDFGYQLYHCPGRVFKVSPGAKEQEKTGKHDHLPAESLHQ